jgi:Resolvase, N terminal domain
MLGSHIGGEDEQKGCDLMSRVSTDKQTVENQLRELRQIAERGGWEVVHEYHDAGISGAKSREARPRLDQMLKDAQRHRFEVGRAQQSQNGVQQSLHAQRIARSVPSDLPGF